MSPRTRPSATRIATFLLICITAVWGSTFFIIRDLVKTLPSTDFLAVRFVIAALIMLLFFARHVRALTPRQLGYGTILGLLYAAAQIFQTVGLEHTAASVSGFITGMYVVFTPLIGAFLFKEHTTPATWVAVTLATAGLAVLSLKGISIGYGELLTLACALLYALHIIGSSRWSKQSLVLGLATVQLMVIAVVCFIAALPDGLTLPADSGQWIVVAYMIGAASIGALLIQTYAQAHLTATRTAITMTLEPVFAAFFAVLLGGESVTAKMLVGGALIVSAMYLIELRGTTKPPPIEDHHIPA